jgi:hypothetical protein
MQGESERERIRSAEHGLPVDDASLELDARTHLSQKQPTRFSLLLVSSRFWYTTQSFEEEEEEEPLRLFDYCTATAESWTGRIDKRP